MQIIATSLGVLFTMLIVVLLVGQLFSFQTSASALSGVIGTFFGNTVYIFLVVGLFAVVGGVLAILKAVNN
jgi:hypothetical protein